MIVVRQIFGKGQMTATLRMDNSNQRGADKVIEAISRKLADGELKPGDKLPAEGQLCEDFGMSRTVIREAIQHLKAIGVLHTVVGSGSYIAEGSLKAMKSSLEFYSIISGDPNSWLELLEMRILLESSCARKLAGDEYSIANLEALKAALSQMEEAQSDLKKFAEADVKFHQVLIEASGNQLFQAVLQSLETLQLRFTEETYDEENGRLLAGQNLMQHKAVVDAIEARNPALAETAMKTHLYSTRLNLEQLIENRAES